MLAPSRRRGGAEVAPSMPAGRLASDRCGASFRPGTYEPESSARSARDAVRSERPKSKVARAQPSPRQLSGSLAIRVCRVSREAAKMWLHACRAFPGCLLGVGVRTAGAEPRSSTFAPSSRCLLGAVTPALRGRPCLCGRCVEVLADVKDPRVDPCSWQFGSEPVLD